MEGAGLIVGRLLERHGVEFSPLFPHSCIPGIQTTCLQVQQLSWAMKPWWVFLGAILRRQQRRKTEAWVPDDFMEPPYQTDPDCLHEDFSYMTE